MWRGTTPNCSSSSTLNYLDQLWMLASDRRHAKDDTALMTELKADWCRVQKLLGRSRDKAGNLMPDWVVVGRRPTYAITRQLTRWTQLSQLRVGDGSHRPIEGYFSRGLPPSKPTRLATAASTTRTSPPSSQTRHAADVSPCARGPCAHGHASPSEPRRRRD